MQKIWVQFLGWEDQLKKELATHSSVLVWEIWEIKPVNLKGNQPWIVIGRTDTEAPMLWPPDMKSWLIWKYPDAGKDWGQEEKGTTEDETVGCHHRLNGFRWTLGVGDGQGGLGCCSSWGHKESDTTEWLNWCDLLSHTLIRWPICWCTKAQIQPKMAVWGYQYINYLY